MKNYTIFLSLLIVFLFPLIATSQNNSHHSQQHNSNSRPSESIGKQMIKIQERLELDGLQAVLVEKILKKYAIQKKELRNQSDSRAVLMAKIRDFNLEQNEELSTVLTEEQIIILDKMFKEQNNQKSSQSKNGSRRKSGKRKRSMNF